MQDFSPAETNESDDFGNDFERKTGLSGMI